MVMRSRSNTHPANVLPNNDTLYPSDKVRSEHNNQQAPLINDTPLGYFSAQRAVVQNFKAPAANENLGSVLLLLGTLVETLKTWMANKENTLPDLKPAVNVTPKPFVDVTPTPAVVVKPVPDRVPVEENTWRRALAPFMNRPNLASSRNSFDTELINLFSDAHDEPSNGFLSAKAAGQKPNDIANGLRATYEHFPYLGQLGTEEHVAAIKVTMMKFGQSPAGIFDEVAQVKGGYNITMKDGFKLHITDEELTLGTRAAKFSGGDEGMVKDACFLFAVMSKRKSMQQDLEKQSDPFMSLYGKDSSYHAHRTYPGVLANAGGGIDGVSALNYLGLEKHVKVVEAHTLGSQAGVPLEKGGRQKNGVIIEGIMEGQLYNKPVSPSLKVVVLVD